METRETETTEVLLEKESALASHEETPLVGVAAQESITEERYLSV